MFTSLIHVNETTLRLGLTLTTGVRMLGIDLEFNSQLFWVQMQGVIRGVVGSRSLTLIFDVE